MFTIAVVKKKNPSWKTDSWLKTKKYVDFRSLWDTRADNKFHEVGSDGCCVRSQSTVVWNLSRTRFVTQSQFPAPFIYSNVAHDKLCIKSKRESVPTGSQLVCDGSAAELFVSEVVEDLRRV